MLALLEEQVSAVRNDDTLTTVERARTVGYLAGISLKAIEAGDVAARLEVARLVADRGRATVPLRLRVPTSDTVSDVHGFPSAIARTKPRPSSPPPSAWIGGRGCATMVDGSRREGGVSSGLGGERESEVPNRNPTTRFGRGQSGNPGGDPKGTSLVARLREELNEPAVDGSPVTRGHQLAAALVDRAVAGDVSAIKLVFAYINGQPIARSERGDPGSFEDPLEDIPIDQLRKALMRITCRRTPTPGRPEVC